MELICSLRGLTPPIQLFHMYRSTLAVPPGLKGFNFYSLICLRSPFFPSLPLSDLTWSTAAT